MNASNKGFGLGSLRADANFGGLASNTLVAYVDVAITGGEVQASITSDGDVGGASVVQERLETFCRVIKAGGVEKKRILAVGSVVSPSGVAIQCLKTSGRVAAGPSYC